MAVGPDQLDDLVGIRAADRSQLYPSAIHGEKVINARGELQASEELREAADTLSKNPASLQLRYLQTLLELGAIRTRPWSSPYQSISSRRFSSTRRC